MHDFFPCKLCHISIIICTIGKYDEALVYYQEALDARRSILGNTHPDTLVSINEMGNVLKAQGEIISAKAIWLHFYLYCNVYLL